MAIAKAVEHTPWGSLVTFSQLSAGNTAQTCSTDGLQAYRVLFATMDCSGAATATCIYTLNSVVGAAYDTLLESDAAAVAATFVPAYDLILRTGDALDVLTGQAGGTDTTAVVIYCLTDDG